MRRNLRNVWKRRPVGTGIATVIMISALLVVMAFTVVGVGFNHLNVSTRMDNNLRAKDLAEAAIAKAISEVLEDNTFGSDSYSGNKTIIVNFPDAPSGANGVVTFDPDTADTLKIPYSTNNFGSENQKTGALGRTVPGDSIHFVGRGLCGGVARTVEAVVYTPRFPYSIASSGPIVTEGGLFVAAANVESDIPNNLKDTQLVTNSKVGANALKLQGQGNNVQGDIASASGYTLDTNYPVNITGKRTTNADPAYIPEINLDDYDTSGKPGLTSLNPSSSMPDTLKGFVRFSGGTFTPKNGRLKLDNAVVYVDGDLTVTDGMEGKGAVVVKGKTTVLGSGGLTSDNMVALLSQGKIELKGLPDAPLSVKGMVYTKEGMNSENAKIRGVYISNSGDQATAMNNTNFVEIKDYSNFGVDVQNDPTGGSSGPVRSFGSLVAAGLSSSSSEEADTTWLRSAANTTPSDPQDWLDNGRWNPAYSTQMPLPVLVLGPPPPSVTVDVKLALKGNIDPETRFYDSATDSYEVKFFHPNPTNQPPGFYKMVADTNVPDSQGVTPNPNGYRFAPSSSSVAPVTMSDIEVKIGNQVYDGTDPTWKSEALTLYLAAADQAAIAQRGSGLTPGERSTLTSFWNNYSTQPTTEQLWALNVAAPASLVVNWKNSERTQPSQPLTMDPTPPPPSSGGTTTFTINMSEFIPKADRVRVLYWREL